VDSCETRKDLNVLRAARSSLGLIDNTYVCDYHLDGERWISVVSQGHYMHVVDQRREPGFESGRAQDEIDVPVGGDECPERRIQQHGRISQDLLGVLDLPGAFLPGIQLPQCADQTLSVIAKNSSGLESAAVCCVPLWTEANARGRGVPG
jgi:hypothetical protein